MREFRDAAPKGVRVVDCPPGTVHKADAYVIGNCLSYGESEIPALLSHKRPVYRYHHDITRAPADGLLPKRTRHIFCSPLQRAPGSGLEGELVPPALDLERFRLTRNLNHRTGACCIGRNGIRQGDRTARRVP